MEGLIGTKVRVTKKVFNQIEVGDIGTIEFSYDWPPRANPTYSVRLNHADYPFLFRKDELETVDQQSWAGNRPTKEDTS